MGTMLGSVFPISRQEKHHGKGRGIASCIICFFMTGEEGLTIESYLTILWPMELGEHAAVV